MGDHCSCSKFDFLVVVVAVVSLVPFVSHLIVVVVLLFIVPIWYGEVFCLFLLTGSFSSMVISSLWYPCCCSFLCTVWDLGTPDKTGITHGRRFSKFLTVLGVFVCPWWPHQLRLSFFVIFFGLLLLLTYARFHVVLWHKVLRVLVWWWFILTDECFSVFVFNFGIAPRELLGDLWLLFNNQCL